MLSSWQSGGYRLMVDDVPTPAPSHYGKAHPHHTRLTTGQSGANAPDRNRSPAAPPANATGGSRTPEPSAKTTVNTNPQGNASGTPKSAASFFNPSQIGGANSSDSAFSSRLRASYSPGY